MLPFYVHEQQDSKNDSEAQHLNIFTTDIILHLVTDTFMLWFIIFCFGLKFLKSSYFPLKLH